MRKTLTYEAPGVSEADQLTKTAGDLDLTLMLGPFRATWTLRPVSC